MKAKTVISFLLAAVAFAIAVVLPNELMALAHDVQTQDLLHHAPILGMATVSLANLDGTSFQTPNPGERAFC
ncbi:hypothetical protein GO730_20850 [Spirosoma sp. HMF3257]|uniref:Uncharacterized protein n=1 Tax=Spirosoma telluris TaxID=2183553 RepID=A0A327NLA5_9BACT|nr:hypothetical protein [Spirosoma telluris]RAI75997.1 hypothetical protein HMF3257_20775 [Spirosoma telluris]